MTEEYILLVTCKNCSCPIVTIKVPELTRALAKKATMPNALIANRTTCLSCGKNNFIVSLKDSQGNLINPVIPTIIEKNTITIKT